MAPTNAKKEALRLMEAKDAIKKMKLRRREGKKGDSQRVDQTVKALVSASVSSENSRGFPQESMVTVRAKRTRGVPEKRQSKLRKNVVVKSEVSGDANGTGNGLTPNELRPLRKSKKSSISSERPSIKIEPCGFDVYDTPSFPTSPFNGNRNSLPGMSTHSDEDVHYSPFIKPSAVTKTYMKRKKQGSNSNSLRDLTNPLFSEELKQKTLNEEEDEDRPSKESRKKPKNFFKISQNSRNIKKASAPMSIKKTSSKVKIPAFSAIFDDVTVRSDHRNSQLYKNKKRGTLVSGFSVTTVSENKLPVVHERSDESSDCDTDEEEPHAENEANNDELCTLESSDESEPAEENVASKPLTSGVQFHFLDGQVVLQMKQSSTFTFCGQVQLKVLQGAVEVLGYLLTPSDGYRTVFSPHGSGLLSLQTVPSSEDQDDKKIDWEFTYTVNTLINEGDSDDCFLLMKKSESTLPFFVSQFVDFKLFPRTRDIEGENLYSMASQKLQCLCDPPEGSNVVQKGELWDQISDDIIENPGCTVLCGGKGVGKSTLLRFLVNRLLSNGSDKVLVLDFDPGQAELTVPGCVSLTQVKNPLLGPNFTHLENPLKCIYIGDINVSNSVSRYMDACLTIISYWASNEELRKLPCIVNTMGFTRGIGITIMVQLLSALQPSRVVQILSKISHFNYPEVMSVEYVKRSCSNSPFSINVDSSMHTRHQSLSGRGRLQYETHVISSASDLGQEVHNVKGFDPRRRREAVILSYLSQMVSPPDFSLLNVVPYCCPLDTLYLNICHESVPPSVTLSAFNANLVALCCVDPADHDVVQLPGTGLPSIITKRFLADCLGFGIVRGIDMETRLLYLLTPVPTDVLTSVNCLVLGAVNLPSLVYFSPPKEPGAVPYVIQNPNKRSVKGNSKCMSFAK